MIAWFEKHLNAAVVFYTAFAWLFGILLVVFCLHISGMNYLPYPGQPYETFAPNEIVDFLPTFNIQATIDIAILISLPVYFLILKKKKSSLWFLLFFLPPLYPVDYPMMVIVFLMPFWFAGLTILLCLRSRQPVNGKKHITYVL